MKISNWILLAAVAGSLSGFAADKKVERTFNSKCGSCHGKDGKAETEKGKKMKLRDMSSAEFQKGSDEDFKKAIVEGMKADKDGVKQEMDGFKDDLKPAEIDALVAYVRAFKK